MDKSSSKLTQQNTKPVGLRMEVVRLSEADKRICARMSNVMIEELRALMKGRRAAERDYLRRQLNIEE